MFHEDSKLAAMINHLMDMIWKAANHLNKGQPIVAALDQPLYVIAKCIQMAVARRVWHPQIPYNVGWTPH